MAVCGRPRGFDWTRIKSAALRVLKLFSLLVYGTAVNALYSIENLLNDLHVVKCGITSPY